MGHSVAPVLATSAPFTAHQPVAAVAHHSVSPAVVASPTPFIAHQQRLAPVAATAAPFTAHQPVSAGLTSSLANVAHHAASPVTHHAAHIARPVVHGPIYRSGIALHGSPFTAFNKGASEDKEEEEEEESDEEERSSGLTYYKLAEEEVTELEVEGRTFEEVSSTTTSATTTAAATMTPSIVKKVKEELGVDAPEISVEEDVLVVKSEGEDETIIAVPVQKIQQLIDALEVLKVFFV